MLKLAREIAIGIAESTEVKAINRNHKLKIDIGLAVIGVLNKTGLPLTLEDLGYVCQCNRTRFQQLEKSGLRKAYAQLSIERQELISELRNL